MSLSTVMLLAAAIGLGSDDPEAQALLVPAMAIGLSLALTFLFDALRGRARAAGPPVDGQSPP